MDHHIEDVLNKNISQLKNGGCSWIFQDFPRHVSSNRQQSLQSHQRCQAARCQISRKWLGFWFKSKLPFRIHGTGMFFLPLFMGCFTIIYGIFFYPCMVYLPLFNNIWLFFLMVHVRKDTGPIYENGCWSWLSNKIHVEADKPHDAIVF